MKSLSPKAIGVLTSLDRSAVDEQEGGGSRKMRSKRGGMDRQELFQHTFNE